MLSKNEIKRLMIISSKPQVPIKQKHSPAGHTYNKVCGRDCYLINRNHRWTFCECTMKRKKEIYNSGHMTDI